MKTPEELNALKNEYTELRNKLTELSEDDLAQVVGGMKIFLENVECPFCGQKMRFLSPNHLAECIKKKMPEKKK